MKKFNISEELYIDSDWDDVDDGSDDDVVGYFICDRHRCTLDTDFCKNFYKTENPRLYNTFELAKRIMKRGFYDDSDYEVVSLHKDGNVKILRWR